VKQLHLFVVVLGTVTTALSTSLSANPSLLGLQQRPKLPRLHPDLNGVLAADLAQVHKHQFRARH